MKKLILACALLAGCDNPAYNQRVYNAWCKLNNRNDITLEEWTLLKRNYMLPGQDMQKAADAENMAAAAMCFSAAGAIKK